MSIDDQNALGGYPGQRGPHLQDVAPRRGRRRFPNALAGLVVILGIVLLVVPPRWRVPLLILDALTVVALLVLLVRYFVGVFVRTKEVIHRP